MLHPLRELLAWLETAGANAAARRPGRPMGGTKVALELERDAVSALALVPSSSHPAKTGKGCETAASECKAGGVAVLEVRREGEVGWDGGGGGGWFCWWSCFEEMDRCRVSAVHLLFWSSATSLFFSLGPLLSMCQLETLTHFLRLYSCSVLLLLCPPLFYLFVFCFGGGGAGMATTATTKNGTHSSCGSFTTSSEWKCFRSRAPTPDTPRQPAGGAVAMVYLVVREVYLAVVVAAAAAVVMEGAVPAAPDWRLCPFR